MKEGTGKRLSCSPSLCLFLSPDSWVTPCVAGWATSLYDWRENKSLSLCIFLQVQASLPNSSWTVTVCAALMLAHRASCCGLVNPLMPWQCPTKPCVPIPRCATHLNMLTFFADCLKPRQLSSRCYDQWIMLKIIALILSLMCWKAK